MKQVYRRDWFEEDGPRYTIEVALLNDLATLTLDTSGAGLHKRGYRRLGSPAPLKETLAAALVLLSRWCPDRPFIDPLCGSGTLPIEAALIGLNLAPGANRSFAAEKWPAVPASLWKKAREEAADLARRDRPVDPGFRHRRRGAGPGALPCPSGGRGGKCVFQKLPAGTAFGAKVRLPDPQPAYGERLGDRSQVEGLYREMGAAFRELTPGLTMCSAHGFRAPVGGGPTRKLYNGRSVQLLPVFGPRPPRRDVQ